VIAERLKIMSKKKEPIYEPKAENDWDEYANWKYFNCIKCGGRVGKYSYPLRCPHCSVKLKERT